MTIDRFTDLLEELVDDLPEAIFQDLNGGIIVEEELKVHPEAADLLVLGVYERTILGGCIRLYYGSFTGKLGGAPELLYKAEMKATLYHEFTHHLEYLGGADDLAVQDIHELEEFRNRSLNE
ncbi:hypothetical protein O6R05_01440 [Peptoniphilus equinus]|uniref:Zinicin-like metallopeptidase n=1 Tax=Peptoniphilus equinus TaxID=3016343 RepID=A0ABY7QWF8_9FIRM|nr:hypothetical protein [Peptoniphilus equinus]WBW50233.1 hypothetical protein O6R05_01440 [Peptoniphilus equinus]